MGFDARIRPEGPVFGVEAMAAKTPRRDDAVTRRAEAERRSAAGA
jgi:hypothetical protein